MIVYEFKLKGKEFQFWIVDEMIRTAQFVRNMALRYWMDNRNIKLYDLNKYCAVLAKQFEWAHKLNSQARQASAERAAFAIQRFFANCKANRPGKKGYPQFQKNNRSVEYKTTGWKLAQDRKHITFIDGFAAGEFKLIGTWDLHFYQIEQIKRVRVVRRANGYYVQFCIDAERRVESVPTKHNIGIDVGLIDFYTDSDGNKVDNPRHLRKSEKALKRQQRRVSKKKKGSNNRKKEIKRLGRKHLKVSRQRQDFAVKLARCVVHSHDVVAYEDLQVRNMIRNRRSAKSISDASWSQFFEWLQYFGKVFGKIVIAVPPQYTSQECSQCGKVVKKALSQRTHICPCGCVLDRDENAALNILAKGLKQYPGAPENFSEKFTTATGPPA
ncbi:MAG: transposase [Chroococcidiopsidaceae cyanobacterium CP_BM_RX_35]|nr:transposase [Chroococcidiopsidaceae cyanobacterium CP_BM_RX_35]